MKLSSSNRMASRSATAGVVCALLAAGAVLAAATPAMAASDSRPYDAKLLRLAELIGSIHYLGVLCDRDTGQAWRDRMTALLEAEGTSALRRSMLTQRFNRGFRNYSRSYRDCTATAQATVKSFITEAAGLTEALLSAAR
jgi:uncharacterized protein (TIGR02301 family)